MSENDAPEAVANPGKTGRNQDGTWPKGVSGNPSGPPKGFRHKTTLAVEALLDGQVEGITKKAVDLALAGDLTAIRVCLDRTVPVRRDRTIAFELPRMETAADAVAALGAVAGAVATGEISPGEGAELGKLVDSFTRAIEAHDLAERIARLEVLAKK